MAEPAKLAPVSPLGGGEPFVLALADFGLRELPRLAKLRIQAMRGVTTPLPAAARALLPDAPNRGRGDDPAVLGRAPGDWLALSPTLAPAELEARLAADLAGSAVVLADVSSMYAAFELRGAAATEVLARDLTLDLEGGAIAPGDAAQSAIAQLPVLVHRPAAGDAWRLLVDRTAARHLRDWLVESARLVLGGADSR